jgi:tetratricopeptide (TPR) repeat protein
VVAANTPEEVFAPTRVRVQIQQEHQAFSTRRGMASLTANALWVDDTRQILQIPVSALSTVTSWAAGRELILTLRPELPDLKLKLRFGLDGELDRWYREIETRRQQLPAEGMAPAPVFHLHPVLVRRASTKMDVDFGHLVFIAGDARTADQGLQLQAGRLGANAVVDLDRSSLGGWHRAGGRAIGVGDDATNRRLRERCLAERVHALVVRMFLLLTAQALLLTIIGVFGTGGPLRIVAVPVTVNQTTIANSRLDLVAVYAWPAVLLLLVWILAWPGLLRATAFVVLLVTGARITAVVITRLGGPGSSSDLWFAGFYRLVHLLEWPVLVVGIILAVRAWRLAGRVATIVPWQTRSTSQKVGTRAVLALTALYAAAAVVGGTRALRDYDRIRAVDELSILEIGGEEGAGILLNEGAELAKKGDLAAADGKLQRALRLWEGLSDDHHGRPINRANLAITLNNLGAVRMHQERWEEAETFYARAVAIADQIGVHPEVPSLYEDMKSAHTALAEVRNKLAADTVHQSSRLTDKGDFKAAEQVLLKGLKWSRTAYESPSPPQHSLQTLSVILYDLGYVDESQGHLEEAEKHFAEAAALGKQYPVEVSSDSLFKETVADAATAVSRLQLRRNWSALSEKQRAADQQYEEAQVKAQKRPEEAIPLFRAAITTWEELIGKMGDQDFDAAAQPQLATAYLELGDAQRRSGKRADAEASFQKSIEYGKKAVAHAPDRPLPRHNLDVARASLEELHEESLEAEANRLCAEESFAEAIDLWHRKIEEQEERLRAGTDRDLATRLLASRLDRLAWVLTHCPDPRLRDAKAAVTHASRAAKLCPDRTNYWFTLALAQYRSGDWRASLASVERVKDLQDSYGGLELLLIALNRQQLKQPESARAALRQAGEWIEKLKRKAENDLSERLRLERLRSIFEALRREAERLILGKDAEGEAVG